MTTRATGKRKAVKTTCTRYEWYAAQKKKPYQGWGPERKKTENWRLHWAGCASFFSTLNHFRRPLSRDARLFLRWSFFFLPVSSCPRGRPGQPSAHLEQKEAKGGHWPRGAPKEKTRSVASSLNLGRLSTGGLGDHEPKKRPPREEKPEAQQKTEQEPWQRPTEQNSGKKKDPHVSHALLKIFMTNMRPGQSWAGSGGLYTLDGSTVVVVASFASLPTGCREKEKGGRSH